MNDKHVDLFDRYLRREMSYKENLKFEERLENEQSLKSEFDEYNLIVQGIEVANDVVLKERLKVIHKEVLGQHSYPTYKPFMKQRILYAAAVILAFIAAAILVDYLQDPDSQTMYAEHYSTYKSPIMTRDASTKLEHWPKFRKQFDEGNFEQAMIILGESELDAEQPVYLIRFYQGMCILELEGQDPYRAIKCFDEVMNSDNDYVEQARWYKAMAALKADNLELAKKILKEITEDKGYKSSSAHELLSEF